MKIIRMEMGTVMNIQLNFGDIKTLFECNKILLDNLKDHKISPFRDSFWAYKISLINVNEKQPILRSISNEKIVAMRVDKNFSGEPLLVEYPVGSAYGLTVYDIAENLKDKLKKCLMDEEKRGKEDVELEIENSNCASEPVLTC